MGTHYDGSDKEQKTLNAFIKLMRSTESINNRLNRHLAEADLTVSQFGVLEALFHLGPLNQKALAEKLLKSGGNITMVVDNLEKNNWVERQKDPEDRRSVLVHLTSDGEEFISSYFPKHLEFIMDEFEVLSDDELESISRICKKLGLQED
ncbi:MarR family winged helix-turn-helix transcriptional regulator [Fodinibius halophilus]|uniref:MarR family transcriptional regulator n=1 Tax=Fodinibius halophilus TaxID=1736908 RepID=A0A6M1T5A7_9BACT|nr:MarR family transcriptional regulator [Fodinibius halophilus]NGP87141.1 MarR family transcriptional regulator [Fodinibius halophilus]